MRAIVVRSIPNPGKTSYTQGAIANHRGETEVVDFRGDPAAVREGEQVRGGFVVAANKKCQIGGYSGARVVFMEVADGAVFGGDGHSGEVVGVADGLEVAANDEEVDAIPAVDLAGFGDGGVDRVESAVALG